MVFPLGEWLILSIGFLAWAQWPVFRIQRSLRVLPLVWFLGWIVELSFTFSPTWDWHFPRIFVLVALTLLSWPRAKGRRITGILLGCICLLVQDLFVLNEPGIFPYDQWLFASIFVTTALLSTHNSWSMVLALASSTLLSMFFTVFLFDGVVRYYNLPNPFLWHFSAVASTLIIALRQLREYYRTKRNLTMMLMAVPQKSPGEEGNLYRKDD